jgi:signal transduction histidine kinase/DNA-binding response OmpR family regulator
LYSVNNVDINVKKIPIHFKIGLLMMLAVILLIAAGYLSYRNISEIVSSITVDVKPENRLLILREISMDLEKAQNSIRIYSLTKDSTDIQPYYSTIYNIRKKVGRLRAECIDDTLLTKQTDTIGRLINENIFIWNKLLNINSDQKAVESLKQLSDSLVADSESANKPEKNIFKRIFSRKTKSQPNQTEIISNLQKIEQRDSITKEKLIMRESQLASTGVEIKKQFYGIIAKIENEISESVNIKASAANKLAYKTYIWLALFSLLGTLLAIIVMFIIVRFVRKTHAYQIALQNSKDETEKLARTKELFIANMSHEIRTPVTAITGFTEQLLHESLDENTTRVLKIIKSSSDHLAKIINDILDFSKLQNDKLVLEKVHFSIGEILEELYLLFEQQAQRNNNILSYSLSPETPPVLLGDPYRLKQIIINLVSNSIKFTKNGKVHFSVKGTKKTEGNIELIIDVVDTGIGIDDSKIDHIFEEFTQEEMSTSRKFGGTGLGLSIVKKLVLLQNGSIKCISRKNQGTQITCNLPYMTGDVKEIKKDILPSLFIPEEIRNLKILIVDDEEYNRLLFKTILDRWKVKFAAVSGALEALELLKTERFNLLFMDIRMPGMDGLKATQIIRDELNISESDMPVICISAVHANEDRDRYSKAGMNTLLPKPFTEEILLTTIISVIKDYRPVMLSGRLNNVSNEPSALEKFNLQNLIHLSGGDEQFVNQMLVTFNDTTQKGLKEMQESMESDQMENVADIAHKLLPPSRHIGASDLCSLLKKIEEYVHNGTNKELIKEAIAQSAGEFEIISEFIKERIDKI